MASRVRAAVTLWLSVFQSAVRSVPEPPGAGHRRAGAAPAARDLRPAAPQAAAVDLGSGLLGRPVPPLASLEERPRGRAARDGGPLARAPLPGLLALHLNPGSRKTTDLRRDQGSHRAHGHREPLAYFPKAEPDPGCQQRWKTFLRNHRDLIVGMDFFVVPTVRFQLSLRLASEPVSPC
jgi:hypothetical protein